MDDIAELSPEQLGRATTSGTFIRFLQRMITGLLGAVLCVLGAAVVVLPVADISTIGLALKFILGVHLFFAGFLFARVGSRPPPFELHFDPKYQEFILVPEDGGYDAASCVVSMQTARLDVSGRHLAVHSINEDKHINIALQNSEIAQQLSNQCQEFAQAA